MAFRARTSSTRSKLALASLVLATAVGVLVPYVVPPLSPQEAFETPSQAAPLFALMGLAVIWWTLRPIWAGGASAFTVRLVVGAYFALLFLGVSSYSAVRYLASLHFPIVADQPMPPVAAARDALAMGLLGGACLLIGIGLVRGVRSATASAEVVKTAPPSAWRPTERLVPVLFVAGLAGCLLVAAVSGQVAILSTNIDATRFRQGGGLGFASLVQYELLLAACVGAVALVHGAERRCYWAAAVAVALLALVAFRVERTPVLVTLLVALIALVSAGRVVRRRHVVLAGLAACGVVLGLGLVRFVSDGAPSDSREYLVRPIFDVAPEFREQAFVYRVYPSLAPHQGSVAIASTAASVVPGTALGSLGIDKKDAYTDISKEYSKVMRSIGVYPREAEKPLRVGLVGELFADFGLAGVIIGMLTFGSLVGLQRPPRPTPLGIASHAVVGALLVVILVTPPPALFPIALVLLGSAALASRYPRFESAASRPSSP